MVGFLPATAVAPESAPTVGLRADIDALPITEETGLEYASSTPGLMHACGHDGHTANLLAAAAVLAKLDRRPNNVTLLFQPAEEGGAGAKAMIDDGALDGSRIGTPVDAVFGLHGWPQLEAGVVGVKPGPLLAATDDFTVTIRGDGGHAATPHMCVDPVVAAAHVVVALQTIASRRVDPTDSIVVTVGSLRAGTTRNVIPDAAELIGTVRTLTPESRRLAETEFHRIVDGVSASLGATATVDWRPGYPVTLNHPGATAHVRSLAVETLGAARVVDVPAPFMGGEDFSFYSQNVPASFFIVGLRPDDHPAYPSLHTSRFDFNDDALRVCANLFVRLATTRLPEWR